VGEPVPTAEQVLTELQSAVDALKEIAENYGFETAKEYIQKVDIPGAKSRLEEMERLSSRPSA
jgi:hypothetical protein